MSIDFMPEAPWGLHSRWLTGIAVDPNAFGATREDIRLACPLPPNSGQYAFLVAWGAFAEHIGLPQKLQVVPLKQKRYAHTPQVKAMEFLGRGLPNAPGGRATRLGAGRRQCGDDRLECAATQRLSYPLAVALERFHSGEKLILEFIAFTCLLLH